MAGIAFWGSKTGQKQGGCCLNARTAKTNRKTTHTLKHMLKLRKFPTDWMLEKNLNGVQKPSNRALNIGKNTRAPMEGIFRGVRPYKIMDWKKKKKKKKMRKKYNFHYCFVLSIKGRVTWSNLTDKVHVASSARTFQLVVWAHKRCCIIITLII